MREEYTGIKKAVIVQGLDRRERWFQLISNISKINIVTGATDEVEEGVCSA